MTNETTITAAPPPRRIGVTIQNLSSHQRKHWVLVTVPAKIAAELTDCYFVSTSGIAMRAVKGRTVGQQTAFYIRADLLPNETIEGALEPSISKAPAMTMHPWCSLSDAGIKLLVTETNGIWKSSGSISSEVVDSSPAHITFKIVERIDNGLTLFLWVTVYSNDPVADFTGKIVWSDRNSDRRSRAFGAISISSPSRMVFDFAVAHGINPGVRTADKVYVHELAHNIVLGDATGLPISGQIQCFNPDKAVDNVEADINNITAAEYGPVVACSDAFLSPKADISNSAAWLAHRNVPPTSDYQIPSIGSAKLIEFENRLKTRQGWFAARPLGLTLNPGQTGNQEDFAATKGTEVVLAMKPEGIYAMRYSVQAELFRGYNHLENDGSFVRASRHPEWVTWSGITHYDANVSRDQLGKGPAEPPALGWRGYDAQHRSQNRLAAYIALSLDYMLIDQANHLLETDRADYRRRYPDNGADSPRGQGRPLQAWANLLVATGNYGFYQLIAEQALQTVAAAASIDRQIGGPATAPIRPLAYGRVDSRKNVFLNGLRAPWVSLWEHGLFIVGAYAAYKVATDDVRENLKHVITRVAELLANWALTTDGNGNLVPINDMAWNNGAEIDKRFGSENIDVGGFHGTGLWTLAGLLVAREWFMANAMSDQFMALNSSLQQIMRDGVTELFTSDEREWFAAVSWPL